ncbi:hypothetical protein A5635_08560 [Mycobacterium asiaticum]|uniref:Lipoprotein n=1 Tax=Mycobacterium asiaticum TaxID=1790 RepID=A0A1A3N4X8_MYCAS|nr:hypothetical protein A5635_08560 [Mycobacterium asiaticum]OBK91965.1 hypothetical protein A5645_25640 [Mycobacterium asiaticum]
MRRRFRLVVAILGALLATSCQTPSRPGRADENTPATTPLEIRHDLDPLTSRFPLIGHPLSASWVTWNNASGRSPGPTTYWIDAVITLEPSTTTALVSQYQATDHGLRPAVQAILQSDVPAGPFLTGTALDDAFGAAVYLDQHDNQLVIKWVRN